MLSTRPWFIETNVRSYSRYLTSSIFQNDLQAIFFQVQRSNTFSSRRVRKICPADEDSITELKTLMHLVNIVQGVSLLVKKEDKWVIGYTNAQMIYTLTKCIIA